MDLLKVNKTLKAISGVQYVKQTGNYYIKVFFATMKNANAFIMNKSILQSNEWCAKIPFDTVESQGIIRVPIELSEEDLLNGLTASCNIVGVKRFQKKMEDGSLRPLQTVLVTFLASVHPDHCTYDSIWFSISNYIRPLLQCFKCYKFGHGSGSCRNMQVCSICSGNHFFKECDNSTNLKCSNCTGPHLAVSNSCPIKSAKIAEIKNKINGKFTYATVLSKSLPSKPPAPGVSHSSTINNRNNNFSKIDHTTTKTPAGRAIISDIINSEGVLHSITKTVIDIIKKKESKNENSPISTQLIKELLITNFSLNYG